MIVDFDINDAAERVWRIQACGVFETARNSSDAVECAIVRVWTAGASIAPRRTRVVKHLAVALCVWPDLLACRLCLRRHGQCEKQGEGNGGRVGGDVHCTFESGRR